ncbi:MAG: ATP-binding protein [Bryobacteraceae bacterium]|jgi:hypothetical protein
MENAAAKLISLKGHDPLENTGAAETIFTQDSTKLQVQNILKCYTHFYDVFAESVQNALDAVEAAAREERSESYQPRLWIRVDMEGRTIRVVDNGIGMDLEQFKYCFRPNVSFKRNGEYRGQKGVGATFLAYGFSFVKLQSKCGGERLAAVLRGGRLWANDATGRMPRPVFEAADWDVPELEHEAHGTCIEITIGREPGERPSDLGWLNATTSEQWRDVLRIKTPLGQIYLTGKSFAPTVTVEVIDSAGHRTTVPNCKTEYFYPDEIPGIKVADLDDLMGALQRIEGDAQTKMRRLDDQYKRLNCVRKIWTCDEIIDPH